MKKEKEFTLNLTPEVDGSPMCDEDGDPIIFMEKIKKGNVIKVFGSSGCMVNGDNYCEDGKDILTKLQEISPNNINLIINIVDYFDTDEEYSINVDNYKDAYKAIDSAYELILN